MAYRDDNEGYRRHQELLSHIRIASPCNERWADMTGDDRVRHCTECNRKVYNLSAMRADEAVRLLDEKEGRKCLRLYKRHDGTVLTTDCPRGAKRRRVRRAVIASTLGVMGTSFGTALEPDLDGVREPPPMVQAQVEVREAAPDTPPDPGWIVGWE